MMEFSLGKDQFQTTSQRSAPRLLDFIGDVGGFLGALELGVAVIGNYFSSKLFPADIANNFFIQKKSRKRKNKVVQDKQGIDNLDQLKDMFEKI